MGNLGYSDVPRVPQSMTASLWQSHEERPFCPTLLFLLLQGTDGPSAFWTAGRCPSHIETTEISSINKFPWAGFDHHCKVCASYCSHPHCPSSSWSFYKEQLYNLSLRSLGESISANEEENVGPWQAASAGPQVRQQPQLSPATWASSATKRLQAFIHSSFVL